MPKHLPLFTPAGGTWRPKIRSTLVSKVNTPGATSMGNTATRTPPTLRLIRGDLDRVVRIGNARIQVSPLERPPFAVNAVAVEQDTALVLGEEPMLYAPIQSLSEISSELEHSSEPLPGSVLVKRGTPKRLFAIIHDLEQDPTLRQEWVVKALQNMIRLAERQPLHAIALPLLGTRYGQLDQHRFIELLCQTLTHYPPASPLKLWLMARRYEVHALLEALNRFGRH